MLKERSKLIAYWVGFTDLALTAVAFLLAWAPVSTTTSQVVTPKQI